MPAGLDNLKHIVVLMMENRSFDHMLGSLKAVDSRIDGITDQDPYGNPDSTGAIVKPQALAEFQAQLQPDPDHHFPAVDLQIFGGDTTANRTANMQGFVKSYFNQQKDVKHSQKIMYYFKQSDLPVLTTLALEFAVFNRWFASIPRAHDLQPRVRALWDFLRTCGHESRSISTSLSKASTAASSMPRPSTRPRFITTTPRVRPWK